MKTLRVCLSRDLPIVTERDKNFIYFVYDKLDVYIGQNYYNEQYAIVESFPVDPVRNMLYFCLDDGIVKSRIGEGTVSIAEVETPEQLAILTQAGSTFFVNANKRYLDLNTKLISLPYKNGNYYLSVKLANDIEINENAVIKFNPVTNEFELVGDIQDFDYVFTRDYTGKETDTTITRVDSHEISTEVKVSELPDNIIKKYPSGLYATVSDRVSKSAFEAWKLDFARHAQEITQYMDELTALVDRAENVISDTGRISDMILASLEAVYPEIDEALANYEEYGNKISALESTISDISSDFNTRLRALEETAQDTIADITNHPWGGI